MGRNEIRLRRQMMNTGRIARHRNYGELMARHERDLRIKRIARIVISFLLIVFLLIIFAIVVRWEKQEDQKLHPEKKQSFSINNEQLANNN